MRFALLFLNASFIAIFAAALAVLTLAPGSVERRAHSELVQRIAAAATERYPALLPRGWTGALTVVLQEDAVAVREEMASPRLEAVAALFASMCRHCEGPEAMASQFRDSLSARLRGLDLAMRRVEDWARGRYHELIDELIADLRIFTATNAVLAMLAALVARRRVHNRTTLLASGILALTAAASTWMYLFRQDWLQTILFADYVGYGYVLWVLLMAGVLFDAAFNQGRVFRGVLNALLPGPWG